MAGAQAALAAVALAAAASDFLDGRLARRLKAESALGRWLDSCADVVFILVALGCEAGAGALPLYIPVLVAASFAQYALDSALLSVGPRAPVRSPLGHWAGIINYLVVLATAAAHVRALPSLGLAAELVRMSAPALALFYLTAIAERVLGYRRRWRPD